MGMVLQRSRSGLPASQLRARQAGRTPWHAGASARFPQSHLPQQAAAAAKECKRVWGVQATLISEQRVLEKEQQQDFFVLLGGRRGQRHISGSSSAPFQAQTLKRLTRKLPSWESGH